ncbi:UvrC protein [Candidatus Pantoea carbekii]|uniref:UvrABC system protein C n=1 Tax=Candidatus Pantoea carbekii TaxID=1235990 RepID=U3U6T2_9GAMM|nr:UvrC protein [Candidatus Pantoea carbekii]
MNDSFDFKTFLSNVTNQMGVYRMYDKIGTVIYVGKSKNLKKRLSTYFYTQVDNKRIEVLVKNIQNIDVTVTHTEIEALLLEHNYIKLYKPRYNILLRDDKSYPYIFLSNDQHPRLSIHYRKKHLKGEYFGPFPNTSAVRKTLNFVQQIFAIRLCENSVYRNRSRPCLQYQIGRCLGPCIDGLVSQEEYIQQIDYVRLFLYGKDDQIIAHLLKRMHMYSSTLHFEEAARLRDQIQALSHITEKQFVSNQCINIDVISVAYDCGVMCLHILFIREGKILGSRSYFSKLLDNELNNVVHTFISQLYLQGDSNLQSNDIDHLPTDILLDFNLTQRYLLINRIKHLLGRKINIQVKPSGNNANYLKLARTNSVSALKSYLAKYFTIQKRLVEMSTFFKIAAIKRIECFDVSHNNGQQTIASCIVFDEKGPLRSAYRRYNIVNITPGDDCAAIEQALNRRYNKIKVNNIPDVIIIDGGKSQFSKAKQTFNKLNIFRDKGHPFLIAVAKARNRNGKKGLETLFFEAKPKGLCLPCHSSVLHLIQYIRDQAHQHAISGHRKKQEKVKNSSLLEKIKGIGPKRRQYLLKHMGGLRLLMSASIEDIAQVPTISLALAKRIHTSFKS